jgi:hypothetical protein
MIRILTIVAAILGTSPAWAQAPAPGVPSGSVLPSSVDPDKSKPSDVAPRRERSGEMRPGTAPPPMRIRIEESGVKLPKCTAESREGEACKQ